MLIQDRFALSSLQKYMGNEIIQSTERLYQYLKIHHVPKEKHPWMDPQSILLIFLKNVQSSSTFASTRASRQLIQYEILEIYYI